VELFKKNYHNLAGAKQEMEHGYHWKFLELGARERRVENTVHLLDQCLSSKFFFLVKIFVAGCRLPAAGWRKWLVLRLTLFLIFSSPSVSRDLP
jgi:hypothetical protein